MASNRSTRFSKELFQIIIGEGAKSFASKGDRHKFLCEMSLMSKKMTEPAQRHLFGNAITFHGNGNPHKEDRGFNNWCNFLISLALANSDKVPDLALAHVVTTIKYIGSVNGDGGNRVTLPADDQHEFLGDIFLQVKKLEMSEFLFLEDPSCTPIFGKSLGNQIETLDLTGGLIITKEFVNFLCLFTKLQYLKISDSLVQYGTTHEGLQPPDRTFEGVLHLHFSERSCSRDILLMFCTISFEMRYSQIILDDQGIFKMESNLSWFLSKFKRTLEYLRFHSESTPSYRVRAHMTTWRLIVIRTLGSWGPVDLTDMGKLQKVAINSRNPAEFGNIVTDLSDPLPLNKITLLLIINSDYLKSLKDREDFRQEWDTLDHRLEHFFGPDGIPGRSEGNPLPFYVIGDNKYHNKKWPAQLLPRFTKRLDVKVDPRLKKCE